ncbi:cytochrome P450 family protein [Actinokineospora sp.]|uniref:cytochrome P450 family protein n=1 Tax=Actinokineospora sp. TaxID=1872133 RepID=UPI004037C114
MRFDRNYLEDPHGFFAELRAAGPVRQVEMPNGALVWVVTRYADVHRALSDQRLSVNNEHARSWPGFVFPPQLNANLMNMDPPDHTRLRGLVTKAFTPRRMEAMRGRIQEIADELIDAICETGSADLSEALAAPLPLTVIGELLGIPDTHHAAFRGWLSTLLMAEAGAATVDEARQAMTDIIRFLVELVADKQRNPGDDLLTDLIAIRDKGDRLSDNELTSLVFLIFAAGYETTVGLIGNAVVALMAKPDQWADLLADPSLLPKAVEEFARFDGPSLLAIRRFPIEDVEIGGVTIPAGDTVLLALAAANRDESRFGDADLDIHRTANAHVGYGHGIHFCLGASLARMEGEIAIGTLLRRLPDLRLAIAAADVRWQPSLRTRVAAGVLVTFTPTPALSPQPAGVAR